MTTGALCFQYFLFLFWYHLNPYILYMNFFQTLLLLFFYKTQNTKQNTVGYGDLTPQTTTERTYSSIIMIIGATVFGYIVGNVSQMVGQLDVGAAKQREQREEVRNYMKVRHFFLFFFFLSFSFDCVQ